MLLNFEPMEKLQNRSGMAQFGRFTILQSILVFVKKSKSIINTIWQLISTIIKAML